MVAADFAGNESLKLRTGDRFMCDSMINEKLLLS